MPAKTTLPNKMASPTAAALSPEGFPPVDDHDSPWKEALEIYFSQMLLLLMPSLHAAIDWTTPVQFLDKELQSINLPGNKGRRKADKLVQVQLLTGFRAWLFIHIEVQRRVHGPAAQAAFARRMYEYHFLIQHYLQRRLKSGQPPTIYSLAILTDGSGPETSLVYTDQYQGYGAQFSFPVVNLDAWEARREVLERIAPANPFAVFVIAQLEATRHPDKAARLGPKLSLIRDLNRYGYSREEARRLARLVDWMIRLPPDLEPAYEQALAEITQENTMTYVTTFERWGIKKGRAQGQQEGQAELLLRQLERRFGPVAEDVTQRVRAGTSEQLELWALNILDATALEDVFRE